MRNAKPIYKKPVAWLVPAGIILISSIILLVTRCEPPNLPYNIVVDYSHNYVFTSTVVDGDNVYTVYCEPRYGNLIMSKSTNGGQDWPLSARRRVDAQNVTGIFPSLANDGQNLYVSYYDETAENLRFAKSSDGGEKWRRSDMKIVDSNGAVGQYSSIAIDGDKICIAYYDRTNSSLKIARSINGGQDWPSSLQSTVDYHARPGICRSIAVWNTMIFIAYQDIEKYNLKVARSEDDGVTWKVFTVDTTDNAGLAASLDVTQDSVYVLYYAFDDPLYQVRVAVNSLNGEDWDIRDIAELDYTGSLQGYYYEPTRTTAIQLNGSTINVVYYVSNTLFFGRSTDDGSTWENTELEGLSEQSTDCSGDYADMAVEGNNIYVSQRVDWHWGGYVGEGDVLLMSKSTNGGQDWQENVWIDRFMTYSVNGFNGTYHAFGICPSMTFDGTNNYVAYWTDMTLRFARISEMSQEVDYICDIDETMVRAGYVTDIATGSDGTNLYVLYSHELDSIHMILTLAKSADSGQTWSKVIVDDDAYVNPQPQMIIRSGNIYIAYIGRYAGISECLAISTDDGESWQKTKMHEYSFFEFNPACVAVNNDYVFCIYYNNDRQLKIARSQDNGVQWEHSFIDMNAQGDIDFLQPIQAKSWRSKIYVVYDRKLRFACSTDNGSTWQITEIHPDNPILHYRFDFATDNELYITYYDDNKLYLIKSSDRGTTWNTNNAVVISSESDNAGFHHDIKVRRNSVYVVYHDVNGNRLKFTKSISYGNTWPAWDE